ncbi:MAG: retroviral-like aspartic protease family protein [Magnetococcales bacterium]|nr:retroviral-like aspartic protease family protein [Magnetococcales bacterium]
MRERPALLILLLGLPLQVAAVDVNGLDDPTRPDNYIPPAERSSEGSEELPAGTTRQINWNELRLDMILRSESHTLAMINGVRVQVGQRLPNGARVERIEADAVVLDLDGTRKEIKRNSCYHIEKQQEKHIVQRTPQCKESVSRNEIEEIPLEREGNTFYIRAKINNKEEVRFVLDTGASGVSIPAEIAGRIFDAKTYQELPATEVTIADGSKSKAKRCTFNVIQVGSRKVARVEGVIKDLYAPPLLGMSFLEKLGNWRLDSKRNMLILASHAEEKAAKPGGEGAAGGLDTLKRAAEKSVEASGGSRPKK